MKTTTAARVRRLIGRMAGVALVALILGGLAATPAGAETRKETAAKANDMIDRCFANGGDPEVIDAGKEIKVECHYHDGSGTFYCSFLPNDTYCASHSERVLPDVPIDPLEPVGSPVTRPGLIDNAATGEAILVEDGSTGGVHLAESTTTVTEPTNAAPTTEQAPADENGVLDEVAPVDVAPVESGDPAPVNEPVADPAIVEPAVVEPVETAAPAESQDAAPADASAGAQS